MVAKTPMYIQLRELLRKKIEDGTYQYGELIPSERELSAQYGLNRMTVRNAISELVEEGTLTRNQGKGTFVSKQKVVGNIHKIQGFGKMLLEKGITPKTKVVYSEIREAGFKYASIFNIDENEKIFDIVRVRYGNDEPISIEDTIIPYSLIPNVEDIDFEVVSLYELLKAHGVKLHLSYESMNLVKVRHDEAKFLNLDDGSTVFLVEVKTTDINGKIVEYTKSYTNSEKCHFYSGVE